MDPASYERRPGSQCAERLPDLPGSSAACLDGDTASQEIRLSSPGERGSRPARHPVLDSAQPPMERARLRVFPRGTRARPTRRSWLSSPALEPPSRGNTHERSRPAEQLANAIVRVPVRTLRAGLELPVLADAHADEPRRTGDPQAVALPVALEHRREHRHGLTVALPDCAKSTDEAGPSRDKRLCPGSPLTTLPSMLSDSALQGGPEERSVPRLTLYVVVGGLILGALGVWVAVTHHPSNSLVVRYIAVGLTYLGVGYWLATKGYARLGLLIAITGAVWFVPELQDSGRGVLVGIAIVFENVYLATYAHAVLAYPGGRIRPRPGVWLVVAGYMVVLGGGIARALTYQPYFWQSCDCPRNSFAVWHTESVYNAVNDPYQLIGLILGIALIPVLAFKLRPADREGAEVLPVWAAFIGSSLILVSGFIRGGSFDLSPSGLILWLWVEGIGLLLTASSFLVLRRQRVSQAVVD